MTYTQVYNLIIAALTGRPSAQKVLVVEHETAEIAILNYIEQLKVQSSGITFREVHGTATADVNCTLTWDQAFTDLDYSFIVNGFDALGNPADIYLISRSETNIVIKTLVDATVMALAKPHATEPVQTSSVREAHGSATSDVNCALTWSDAFPNTNYSYFINGFDSLGNPAEIFLISRSATTITIKTLVNATINAIAIPHSGTQL